MQILFFSASLLVFVLSLCPDGFQSISGGSCTNIGHANDYVSAALECSKLGGSLASVSSGFQNSQYKGVMANVTGRVYLGGGNFRNSGAYSWIDGTFMAFTNWAPGQPSTDRANCVAMDVTTGRWYSTPLETQLPYLCVAPGSNPCAEDWTLYNGECYKYFDAGLHAQVSAMDAETYCVGFGAHLASVLDDRENKFVIGMSPPDCSFFWIGLQCTNGKYTWTDGTPVLYHDDKSCTHQPSYYAIKNGGCGGTLPGWMDASADTLMRQFLCKKAAAK